MNLITSLTFFFSSALLIYPSLLFGQSVKEPVWAARVMEFSSEFSPKMFSAAQVLYKPDAMPQGGKSPCSWKTGKSSKKEFIKVGYTRPVLARQIIISENYNPGAIIRISVFDVKGKEYTVAKYKPDAAKTENPRLWHVRIPDNIDFQINAVKLYLDTEIFKQSLIDAIGISEDTLEYKPQINIAQGVKFSSKPENLGRNINSPNVEVMPVIAPDGNTLYFTRFDDKKQSNIWMSKLEGKTWGAAMRVGEPLNSIGNNSLISLTPDGSSVLLMGVYGKTGKEPGISIAKQGKTGWKSPVKLEIPGFYNLSEFNEFCLSGDGRILIMSVEMNDSEGGQDLYISFMNNEGKWSRPRSMGGLVNTAAHESSPYLASDSRTLYYSTSGFSHYGGGDIFVTKRLDESWRNWSEPQNLGEGINTPQFDAYFSIPASGEYALMVSNANSLGAEDIFKVKLPGELRPDPVAMISGKVLNAKTNEPLFAEIVYEILPSGDFAGIAEVNEATGEYTIILPRGKKYGYMAKATGYVAQNENIDLSEITEYRELKKDLLLMPIEAGQIVTLNNIFFELGSAELKPESFPELNRLSDFITSNSKIQIEIGGHSDNTGSLEVNNRLSEERAKAVYDYLMKKKRITSSRLQYKGYGPSKPIADNATEEGRKLNRRVEFIILKTE